jgi:2'-5' RNA ligase
MRLFIALAPPDAVVENLAAACAPFRAQREDLRWTPAEAWHVTLAFLGEVSEVPLARLLPRMERAARRHLAFGLSFAGAGAFPSPGRATVLWSGLAGDRRALGELAQTVAAGAGRAGVPPPDAGRRYRPHLTLARCRAPADVSQVIAGLDGYAGPAWQAAEMHLIRSHLGVGASGTPRYETLETYPLQAAKRSP